MTNAQKRTLTVGLLWHSITSANLGVGALTLSQMTLITKAAHQNAVQVRFIVIGTCGSALYPIKDFDVAHSAKFSLRTFAAGHIEAILLLRKCDIIFDIGEGDSFADIYGKKRLITLVFSKLLAKLYRKPLILSPQTIGPFRSATGKLLGKFGLRIADRIYARDTLSMQYLDQLGYRDKSVEVIDVAFALPFDRPSRPNDQIIRVGINISGLLYNGGYSGHNQFGLTIDYRTLIENTCEYFLSKPNTEIYLVHHVFSDTDNSSDLESDLYINRTLSKRYTKLKIAPLFRSPIEAKSFISGMDFFTGARMHACIAAFSSGVPVLPMAYSRKFNGLFESLEYPYVLDCLTLDTSSALQMLIHSFENRIQLTSKVEAGNRIAKEKLETYVNHISDLLI
jgi:polysaccharide pyruvyl transferase WcaK-like protein